MCAPASSSSTTALRRPGWSPRRGLSTAALTLLVLGLAGAAQAAPARRAPAAAQKPLVAVLPPKALGVEKPVAAQVQAGLIQAVKGRGRFRVLSAQAIQKALDRQPAGAKAAVESLVPALRSRWALSGTLAGLGEALSLDLKLLEGSTGAEVRRASVELPADAKARAAALEELVIRLLEPERWVGSLQLEVSEAGAQVWLDGVQVASTPLAAPLTGLAPGKHILMIRKEGQAEFSKFVVVRFDQVAQLKVDLDSATVVGLLYDKRPAEPRPRPAPPRPALLAAAPAPEPGMGWQGTTGWSLLSVGAAGAVAGGLLAWHVEDLE
ncbi:MAG TPA: PEGA domain-containing protein, partial [Myxococcota bacterium]|nr:PEGA domain-containing protein [Myxococcota bacterium]